MVPMIAVDHHRKLVPQSQRYYEKKRANGKRHNQVTAAYTHPLECLGE